jgi:hypothetical protein
VRYYLSPIFALALALILCGATASVLAAPPVAPTFAGRLPDDWQKGAVLLNFGPNPYRPSSREALDALAATGANWVAISPIWYMDEKTSNAIYPDEGKASPGDASVIQAIAWA